MYPEEHILYKEPSWKPLLGLADVMWSPNFISSRPGVIYHESTKNCSGNIFVKSICEDLCRSFFVIMSQVCNLQLIKRDSNTGIFLSVLGNFLEHIFSRKPNDERLWNTWLNKKEVF